MAKSKQPAVEGWFTMTPTSSPAPEGADPVALIGTRCTDSGTYFFPPERVMSRAPGFADSVLVDVELSTRGKLWSYTDAQYQPPEPFVAPSEPYAPFCLAAVELAEEKLVVLGQVVDGVDVDDLKVGMEMELVLGTLYEDDEHEYTMWKWRPVGVTTGTNTTAATAGDPS
ncbi:zinc ribbon domain-containing protein [soil metagenome]